MSSWDWENDDWGEEHSAPAAAADAPPPRRHGPSPELVARFVHELKAFQQDLADPQVRARVNGELSGQRWADLEPYYLSHAATLRNQTLKHDLHRMRYHVVTQSGQEVSDTEGVRALADNDPNNPVWLVCNQSIFAHLLIALQSSLLRPDLSVSVSSRESWFKVHLANSTVQCATTFVVATVQDDATPLELGTIQGEIRVSPEHGELQQCVQAPRLNMVFDDDWERVARVLAEHHELAGGHEPQGMGGQPKLDAVRRQLMQLTHTSRGVVGHVVGSLGSHLSKGVDSGLAWAARASGAEEGTDGEELEPKAAKPRVQQAEENAFSRLFDRIAAPDNAQPAQGGASSNRPPRNEADSAPFAALFDRFAQ